MKNVFLGARRYFSIMIFGYFNNHCYFCNIKHAAMSSKEYVKLFSKHLFWDADPKELDMDKYPAYIIPRVLEHGEMEDWKLLNKYYGLDKIVEVCKSVRTLDPMCLSFICTISHTKEEEYRCYHFRQSFPTPWNS